MPGEKAPKWRGVACDAGADAAMIAFADAYWLPNEHAAFRSLTADWSRPCPKPSGSHPCGVLDAAVRGRLLSKVFIGQRCPSRSFQRASVERLARGSHRAPSGAILRQCPCHHSICAAARRNGRIVSPGSGQRLP